MKLKVCGMRDSRNISELYNEGVRTMGFIFYDKSKRFVSDEIEEKLFNDLPEDLKRVGVFVNESVKTVIDKIKKCGLDFVQLHGEETPKYCKKLAHFTKVIKAFRVDESFDFSITEKYNGVTYFLFDAKGQDYGGNGIKYDWTVLHNYKGGIPFLLSGGIGPSDRDRIIEINHPMLEGIDVNSGFEIEPGLKDVNKIKSFTSQLKCSTL